TVGGLPYAVSHACLVAHQHNLYLMGGRKRNSGGVSEFYDGVWRYEVATDRWTARSPLPEPLSAATAVAMGDDDILFMGGDDGGTFRQVERTIAAVTQETDTTRQVGLTQQKIALLENHPGFGGAVLRYDTQDDTWHADSEIAPTAPVTTTAVWWHGNLYLPSGEIRAGIRTPNVWIRKNTANPTNQPIRP
ncbi:kelch repeat-containing protein, partial [Parapedobacter sp.]